MSQYKLALLLLPALIMAACSQPGPTGPDSRADNKPAAATDGIPIELTPAPEGFPLGLSVSEGFAFHLLDTPDQNHGFKKFPPEQGYKRHYDQLTIAGKRHLVIMEESKPPRLYFDENRNGDLTDDRSPSEGEAPVLVPNHYAIHLRYDEEKVIAPYRFWLFNSNMGGVRFYSACHWHGSITVNDKSYKVVAFDSNADGDYSNDPVVIDANGNGKADEDEKLSPGRSIVIDGRQVTLSSVSKSGLTVRFRM